MKIAVFGLLIFFLLFWSPWMAHDGGEEAVRKISKAHHDEIQELTKQFSLDKFKGGCDGLSSKWAPFGRKVYYCQYKQWYAPFWE